MSDTPEMTAEEFRKMWLDGLARNGGRLRSLGHVLGLWNDDDLGLPVIRYSET